MDAITWLEQKSDHEDYGYFVERKTGKVYHQHSGFFKGQLPYRMVKQIIAYAKEQDAGYHGSNKSSTLYWAEGDTGYAVTHGAYKSTFCNINFTYTVTQECPEVSPDGLPVYDD